MASIPMFDLGPPRVDTFSMISNLGKSFFDAYDAQRKRRVEDEADKLNADYGKALQSSLGTPDPSNTPAAPSRSISEVGKLPSFAQSNDLPYASAIKSIESGGKYGIVGPTHPKMGRALGAYQVMEANLPQWSKEALGRAVTPDEFLSNPGIQDQIFNYKFGQYVQKYGNPQDAASVWFSGRPLAGNNSKDVLGTSVPSYVAKFNSAMQRNGGAPAGTQVASVGAGLGYAPDTSSWAVSPRNEPARNATIPNPSFSPQNIPSVNAAIQNPVIPVPFEQAIPGAMQFASLGGVGGAPTMPAPQMAAPAPQAAPVPPPTPPPAPAPVQMAQAAPAAPVASDASDPILGVLRRLPPAQQQWYLRALSNRITAPAAMQRLQSMVRQNEYSFSNAPDGSLVRTNKATGAVERVPGYEKPQDRWQYQEQPNGDLIGTNAATGKREVLNAGERDAVLRQYDRAKREGFQGGIFDFKRLIAEAGASRTNVNTNPGPAAAVYKSMEDRSDQARSAANALPSFAEAKRLIDSGQIILGAGADMRLAMTKIGALLGMDGESAANTETFRSTVAPTVLALVKGLGAGSGISNADREFAEKAAGGNINLEPTAIKRLMEIGVKAAEAKVKQHNALIDKIYPESDPQNAQVRALFRVDVPENYPEPEKPAEKPKETAPAKGTDRKPLPDGYSAARALDEAKKAIKAGRDPEGVKERLRQHGIDPKRLEE